MNMSFIVDADDAKMNDDGDETPGMWLLNCSHLFSALF